MNLITYNACSMIQPARALLLAETLFFAHIICIQGTRCRAPPDAEGPVLRREPPFVILDWGYGRGAHTNKAAGVQIWLRSPWFRPCHFHQIYTPPPSLRGRGGAVRLRSGRFDMLILNIYPPPRTAAANQQKVYTATLKSLFDWASSVLRQQPARTAIFIAMDLNDTLGVPTTASAQADRQVGRVAPDPEHAPAAHVRQILLEFDLCIPSTFIGRGEPTYFGQTSCSRIDFWAAPAGLLHDCERVKVLGSEGTKLQLANCQKKIDHYPLLYRVRPDPAGSAARRCGQLRRDAPQPTSSRRRAAASVRHQDRGLAPVATTVRRYNDVGTTLIKC